MTPMLTRVAAHVHSEWSYDAKWPLARLAEAFSRRGCRALLMTEHQNGFSEARWREYRAACRSASNDRILLVPGIEYSDPSNTIHILVWGDLRFWAEEVVVARLLGYVAQNGGAAVFAHPSRRAAWRLFQDEWEKSLVGIELWNRKTDGWAPSPEAGRLLSRVGAMPFAGLDFHDFRQFFPLTSTLELELPVSEASVISCLRQKRFRSYFLGMPAEPLHGGFRGWTLSLAERARRLARPLARAVRGWRHAREGASDPK